MQSRSRVFAGFAVVVAGLGLGCGAEQPERDTLRVAIHRAPAQLVPHLQNERMSQALLANVYEPLVELDHELGLRPVLAQRWESPDDLTWRFALQEARFHDGRPVEARDVVASLERVRRHRDSQQTGVLVAIESVRALDTRTVEVRTHSSTPHLLHQLTSVWIVPHDIEDGAPLVGSGRYRLVGGDPDNLRFEAFGEHRAGLPPWSVVEVGVVPDVEDRIAGLRAGEVDLVTHLPPADHEVLSREGAFSLVSEVGTGVTCLVLNSRIPPLDDRRVREAVHFAVDREAIVRETRGGLGVVLGQTATRWTFGHVPDMPAPVRDLRRSRELLAEAGFRSGVDLRLEHAASVEVGFLRDQLGEAGIRLETVPVEPAELYARITGGEIAASYLALVGTAGSTWSMLDSAAHSAAPESGYGDSNWTGLADPELDEVIEAAATARHLDERRRLLQEAMRRWMSSYTTVPLFSQVDLYGIGPDVVWDPRPDILLLFAEVGRSS